jgi:hypothetical protein
MPCSVAYLEHDQIVETSYVGVPSIEELQAIALETLVVAKEKNTRRLLGNCAGLEQKGTELDIYSLIQFFESLPIDRQIKEAMLLPPTRGTAPDIEFYETVARNRGFNVRIFFDRQEAINWLTA